MTKFKYQHKKCFNIFEKILSLKDIFQIVAWNSDFIANILTLTAK